MWLYCVKCAIKMKVAASIAVLLCICTSVSAQEQCPNPEDDLPDNLVLEEYPDEKQNESAELRVRCAPGYVSHGKRRWTIRCFMEGSELIWTKPNNPECRPVSCGHPGYVRHGRLRSAVFAFPNSVKYECDVGYKPFGRTEIYCQSNGRWDSELPRCEVVRCGSPEGAGNGTVAFDDDQYESIAQYRCSRGFKREGETKRTCGADGKWSGSPPVCKEVTCPPPGIPDNGGWTHPPEQVERPVDFEVRFYCPENMTLIGSDTTKCLEEGMWVFEPPQCRRQCYVLEQEGGHIAQRVRQWLRKPYHERVQAGTWVPDNGTEYLLQCKHGYETGEGQSMVLRCQDGTWWPIKRPICNPSPCRSIQHLQHGRTRKPIVEHDEKVKYECDPGYDLIDGEMSVCKLGRVDQQKQPWCKPQDCKLYELPEIVHGRPRNDTGVAHGTHVHYDCDQGYELSTGYSVLCSLGQWRGQPGHCMPKGCRVPSKIPNGFHLQQTDTVPHSGSVIYNCANRYKMEGKNELRCMLGKFNGTPPSCKKDFCGFPSTVSLEGMKDLESDLTDAVLKYDCEDGYETNIVKGRCENGMWRLENASVPLCKRTFCDHTGLPILTEGVKGVRPHINGEKLQYECMQGYNKTGAVVMCENGTWVPHSTTDRFCRTQTCDPSSLPLIKNGSPKPGYSVTMFSTVEYRCAEGYHLAEPSNVTCISGEWLGKIPVCRPTVSGCHFGTRATRFKAYDGNQRVIPFQAVPHDTTLKYHCEPLGILILKGARNTTCNNGTWDAHPPFCYDTPEYGPRIRINANPSAVGPGGIMYVEPYTDIVVDCDHGWKGSVHVSRNGKTRTHGWGTRLHYKLSEGEDVIIQCNNGEITNVVHLVGRRLNAGCRPFEDPVILIRNNQGAYQVSCRPPYENRGPKYTYCFPFNEWSHRPVCRLPDNTTRTAMPPGAVNTVTLSSGRAPTSHQQSPPFNAPSLQTPPKQLRADIGQTETGISKSRGVLPTASSAVTRIRSTLRPHEVPSSTSTRQDADLDEPRPDTRISANRTGEHVSTARTEERLWEQSTPAKPSLAGWDHVHTSATRRKEAGLDEQVPATRAISSHPTGIPTMPSEGESKNPQAASFSRRPCILVDIQDSTKIFVGFQRVEGWSSFPDGFSGTFHCEPVGLTVGGPVDMTCEDGQWIYRTITPSVPVTPPLCHRATDVLINISSDYILGPGGTLFVKPNTSVNVTCSHGESSALNGNIVWNIRRRHDGRKEDIHIPDRSSTFTVHDHESYVCECKSANVTRSITIEAKDAKICLEPVLMHGLKIVERDEARLRFHCDGNMSLHGDSVIECMNNGQWNRELPSCINLTTPVQGGTRDHDLPSIDAPPRTTDTHRSVSQEAQIPAVEEHISDQRPENERVPTQLARTCPAYEFLEEVSGGVIIDVPQGNAVAGSSFDARCEADGHVLVGDFGVVTCREDGTWRFSRNLRCEEGCPNFAPYDPSLIIDGRRDTYRVGDSITLKCPEGYTTEPHVERILCMGTWTPSSLPKCVHEKTSTTTPRPRPNRAGRGR